MPVVVPTDIDVITDAIEAKLAADLGLAARDVFSTIADDADVVTPVSPAFFVTLHAGVLRQRGSAGRPPWAVSPFTLEDPMTASAGRSVLSVNGSVQIKLWIQFKLDDPRFEPAWLKTPTSGAWKRIHALLKSLHMFYPTNVGGDYLLQEPMRCHGWASFPYRSADQGRGESSSWGRLETDWDFSYLQDIS